MSAGDEHPAAVPSVLVHVPHASRAIPPDVRAGIELADDDLERELDRMTDSFTDRIAAQAAELARAAVGVLAAPQSRLVVDVERFPDEREAMNAVGMGAVYTRTHDGRVLRREFDPGLLDRCFHPHAAAVTREVERMLEHHGRAVLVDLHSYPTVRQPYELAGPGDPRPQVCLGTDSVHTPPWLRDAAAEAFAGLDVALDSPFAGHLRPAPALRHRRPRRLRDGRAATPGVHGRDRGAAAPRDRGRRDPARAAPRHRRR